MEIVIAFLAFVAVAAHKWQQIVENCPDSVGR